MWDKPDVLNLVASAIYAVAIMLLLYGLAMAFIALPIFPLREMRIEGSTVQVTREQVEAITRSQLRGNFFTLDMEGARQAFEKLPWVRSANLRRQWPDELVVALEQHVALARWGDSALVNSHGELFQAASDHNLPVLYGPQGSSVEVARRYHEFQALLGAIGRRPVEVRLSARRAWQVRLDDGCLLKLGRDSAAARLSRFVTAYAQTVALLPHPPYHVDLRYSNGFAVRAQGPS